MTTDLRTRVLIVDPHNSRAAQRELLEVVLADRCTVVGDCGSAAEALAMVELERPQVVLTGLMPKGMPGVALIRTLAQRYPALGLIVWTFHDSPEYVRDAMRAGARGYILKSAPIDDVGLAIAAVLAGGRFLSQGVVNPDDRAQGGGQGGVHG
jgi:DNA-binding NarL/FixJ family response regulator